MEYEDEARREQYLFQAQPLQLGRDYSIWTAWNKPMRWRTEGEIGVLPGQGLGSLGFGYDFLWPWSPTFQDQSLFVLPALSAFFGVAFAEGEFHVVVDVVDGLEPGVEVGE